MTPTCPPTTRPARDFPSAPARDRSNSTAWSRTLGAIALAIAVGLTAIAGWAALPAPVWADAPVTVEFFYSHTCPHCAEQKPLMQAIDRDRDATVRWVEVGEEPDLWQRVLRERDIKFGAVPRTFVGDVGFVGYSAESGPREYNPVYQGYTGYRNQILAAIEAELGRPLDLEGAPGRSGSVNPGWAFAILAGYAATYPFARSRLKNETARRYWFGGAIAALLVSAFIFVVLMPETAIRQFAEGLPFPLFVSVIALADGFNPCAFAVLVVLLSLLTYTHRRRDMAIVGGTFVVTSAVMYFLFVMLMVAVGSVFLERYGRIFVAIVGAAIAIAGLVNLKDFFWFKQSVSLTLSESQQATINQRAGKIVRGLKGARSRGAFAAALGGTIALAIFVNIIELGCTAILPAVYMTKLLSHCPDGIGACHAFWTGIYAAVYVVPLLAILLNFIYSFKSARLTETQGRRLKLLGGALMLFFGLTMIFRPELLVLAA